MRSEKKAESMFKYDFFLFCFDLQPLVIYYSNSIYSLFSVKTPRSREVLSGWQQGPPSERQREKNPETSDHLLQSAAAGSAPALPADPVPGLTRARRPGGQTGTHPDSGEPSFHPDVLHESGGIEWCKV